MLYGLLTTRSNSRGNPGSAAFPTSVLTGMNNARLLTSRKHLVRYYGALGPRSKIRRAVAEGDKFPATLDQLQAGFAVEGLLAAAQGVAR